MTYQTSTRKQVSDVRSVILRTLRDRGPMTSAELEDALRAAGIRFTGRVRDRLGELVRRNLVAKTGQVRDRSPVYQRVTEVLPWTPVPKEETVKPVDPEPVKPVEVVKETVSFNIPVNVDFIVGPALARVLKRFGGK